MLFGPADLAHDGPPPAPPAPPSRGVLATAAVVELDRLVNASGLVSLAGGWLQVGYPLAGQRVTLRLEQQLVHVVVDGRLCLTLPSPVPPAARARLRGAVEVDDTCFRILDQHNTMLTVVPRTNTEEVTRYKAYGHKAARA
jgi:hypothetical protein